MLRRRGEDGQTLVETALILPMMIFFILGIIQLGLMQQAQLMTEYAAYRAARAGIVNHADCDRMREAAFVALLPTLGTPQFRPPNVQGLPQANGQVDEFTKALAMYKAYTLIPGNNGYGVPPARLPKVRIEVLNPRRSTVNSTFQTYGLQQRELDFDDTRPAVRDANLLSVRVRYFYEMRIPFANKLIHAWWMGMNYLYLQSGLQFENQSFPYGADAERSLEWMGMERGQDYVHMSVYSDMPRPRYLVPLVATYSMRMQSNMFRAVSSCAYDQ